MLVKFYDVRTAGGYIAMFKNLQLTLFALGVCLFAQVVGADSLDAGLLYDDFNLTLAPGHRTEIAGPAFYFEEKETQKQWALPPLWSDTRDSATDSEEMDFLYPLLTWDGSARNIVFKLFSCSASQVAKIKKRTCNAVSRCSQSIFNSARPTRR